MEDAQLALVATPVPRGFLPKKAIPQAEPMAQWTPTPEPTVDAATAAQKLEAYLFNEARWIDINLFYNI